MWKLSDKNIWKNSYKNDRNDFKEMFVKILQKIAES